MSEPWRVVAPRPPVLEAFGLAFFEHEVANSVESFYGLNHHE